MTTYSKAKPAGRPTWVDLNAPDAEAARKFYQALFGWEYEIGGPEYRGYATARLNQRRVAGIAGPMPGAPGAPPAWSIYFASDNAEADAARAAKLGARVLFPAMAVGTMGSMAVSADPAGAPFGFWQAGQHYGSEVSDEPGSTTWYELYAPDAKKARDFYMALLHATAEVMPGDMEYYTLKHGEEQLAGIMNIDPSWGNFPPKWMTYFAVANADATAALVSKLGGKVFGNVEDSPYGRLAAVADPFGAQLKIVQLPAPA
jgi:uncharacterized protein